MTIDLDVFCVFMKTRILW